MREAKWKISMQNTRLDVERDNGYTYQSLKEMVHCSVELHGEIGA